jgi:hypothetical protein
MGLQAVLITFGNTVFHCVENGLTGTQWGISFGFGAITFVVSVICKVIPLEILIEKCLGTVEDDDDEEDNKEKNDDNEKKEDEEDKNKILRINHSDSIN